MKKIVISAILCCAALVSYAQRQPSAVDDFKPEFTTVKANPITSIKNQANSGTCWAYSTISFF